MDRDGTSLVQGHMVKLDPDQRPGAIDLFNLDKGGNPSGPAFIRGIYKSEGDVLTLCLSFSGLDRPTDFATRPGPGSFWLDVYQRDSLEQRMIQSRALEDALYDLLKRERELNDPRWPFVIKVRDVKGRNMIDATFRHTSKGKNSEYDAVIQATSAVLRIDVNAPLVRVFFEEPAVQHFVQSADLVLRDKNTLEFAIPGGNPLEAMRTFAQAVGGKVKESNARL